MVDRVWGEGERRVDESVLEVYPDPVFGAVTQLVSTFDDDYPRFPKIVREIDF